MPLEYDALNFITVAFTNSQGGDIMRFQCALQVLALVLMFSGMSGAQEKTEREINMHNNVRLLLMAVPLDMPKELKDRYESFLPLFEEVLKENTSDREPDRAITIRLFPGVKEIGSAKTKRAIAKITAYRKDSKKEFIGNFLIYSYATGRTVNKEEIGQFLKQQILSPLGIS
jgi:hypothetical protein